MSEEQSSPVSELPAPEKPDRPCRELVLWFAYSQLDQRDPSPYWLDAYGQLPDVDTRAWCGVFDLWCLRQAGLTNWHWEAGKGFASRLHQTSEPQPGDVVYFDKPYQHHALLVKVDGDLLHLIQGNYGAPGRVALSIVSRRQKRPLFYSIAQLLPKTRSAKPPQPAEAV